MEIILTQHSFPGLDITNLRRGCLLLPLDKTSALITHLVESIQVERFKLLGQGVVSKYLLKEFKNTLRFRIKEIKEAALKEEYERVVFLIHHLKTNSEKVGYFNLCGGLDQLKQTILRNELGSFNKVLKLINIACCEISTSADQKSRSFIIS